LGGLWDTLQKKEMDVLALIALIGAVQLCLQEFLLGQDQHKGPKTEGLFYQGPDFPVRPLGAVKDQVPALYIGTDPAKPLFLQQGLELFHGDQIFPTYVYAPQQSNPGLHGPFVIGSFKNTKNQRKGTFGILSRTKGIPKWQI